MGQRSERDRGDDAAGTRREMRFAAMMDHPNIVTVYTTGTYDGAPYMVMEYLRGQDLEKALPAATPSASPGSGGTSAAPWRTPTARA
jgi:serine/threonine protein kinase